MTRAARSSANAIYALLKTEAGPAFQESLDRIHQACVALVLDGDRELRTVTVARLCESLGGPAENTIHNDVGNVYKRLIQAHRDEARSKVLGHSRRRRNRWHDVQDLSVLARIGLLERDNRTLERRLHYALAHRGHRRKVR